MEANQNQWLEGEGALDREGYGMRGGIRWRWS